MNNWLLLGAGMLGMLVGAVAIAAFRFSEQSTREQPSAHSGAGVSEDVASILSALNLVSVLLDEDDEVVRATPDAYSSGLVRHGRIWSQPVKALIQQARTGGTMVEESVSVPRSPLPGSDEVFLQVRVTPLAHSRVLILADDRTAEFRLHQVRRDFVANVSHELKTPVGAVSLLAETVVDAAEDPVAVRNFGARMVTEVKRLAALVQDIIDLSRLEAPEGKKELGPVDVPFVLEDAVDRVRTQAEARRVTINSVGGDDLEVLGDAGLLITAVRNLLDNAIRYSPEGSAVGISAKARDGVVEFIVVDRGVGIPLHEQERVFERFYRGDPARSRDTGGTGLGLSIVRHVAANHGGNVTVWSAPGRGSTFTLRIPEAETGIASEETSLREGVDE